MFETKKDSSEESNLNNLILFRTDRCRIRSKNISRELPYSNENSFSTEL